MSDELEQLAENAGGSIEMTCMWGGNIWNSAGNVSESKNSQSVLPAGLHIGCGMANMETSHPLFGQFSGPGPSLTALYVPHGGAVFETKMRPGKTQSFGIHLPDIDELSEDPVLREILLALKNNPMVMIQGSLARRVPGLSAPIEPWFSDQERDLILKARGLELTALISSAVGRSRRKTTRVSGRKKAYEIRDYIEANLSEKLSLDLIACKNGLSVRALTSVFKAEFDESIGQYLTRRRMECALVMLSEGASVNQTAYALGYQATSFSTAFARHFGYSPSCLLTK